MHPTLISFHFPTVATGDCSVLINASAIQCKSRFRKRQKSSWKQSPEVKLETVPRKSMSVLLNRTQAEPGRNFSQPRTNFSRGSVNWDYFAEVQDLDSSEETQTNFNCETSMYEYERMLTLVKEDAATSVWMLYYREWETHVTYLAVVNRNKLCRNRNNSILKDFKFDQNRHFGQKTNV